MQKKPFSELGLSPEIMKAVAKMGYEEASPIQSEAIPVLMGGSDVVGQSQTGSGKTAAFAIPAIEKVDAHLAAPQVLILCPTRELAVQVAEEVAKLATFKRGVRELPIYGGASYERQYRGLKEGAQIIIGTPGRVMDHLDRGSLKLDQMKMVILDEADRMLDMGFRDDIQTILEKTPEGRQTVLFSATLPRGIQDLIRRFTSNPVSVKIESQEMSVPAIDQIYYEVDRRSKLEVLTRLIDFEEVKLGIIFCATKMMVDDLTEALIARGYSADKLHGDMTQMMRERVMARFKRRACEFLVATDVAARGLDVDDIEVVFNFDLPNDAEDYVHRIGRTGRAGRAGRAITFVAGREIYKMQNIIRFTRSTVRRGRVPSMEEVEERKTNQFFETLKETLEKGEFKKQDGMIDRLLEQGHSPTDIASALMFLLGGDKAGGEPARGSDREEPRRNERSERNDRGDRGGDRREGGGYGGDRRDGGGYGDSRPPRPREGYAREPYARDDRPAPAPRPALSGPPPMRPRPEPAERPARPARAAAAEKPVFLPLENDAAEERPRPAPRPRPEPSAEPAAKKPAAPAAPTTERVARAIEAAAPKPAGSGKTESVYFSVGEKHEIQAGDLIGVVAGVCRLPKEVVASVKILARQSVVEIDSAHAAEVAEKLNGVKFKGRRLFVSRAQ